MAYKTKQKYNQSRVGDNQYAKNELAKEPFEVANGECDSCNGSINLYFKKGKAHMTNDFYLDSEEYIDEHEQISSSLMLYRVISLFKCGIDTSMCDYYKRNWAVTLRHKSTGLLLIITEWKGGFAIATQAKNVSDLPDGYVIECERLLTQLVSNKMPIDYDGVVAGSVA